jgi:hypothetical protein
VEILEDEHHGLLLGERLEEAPPRSEGLVEARLPGRPPLLRSEQREQVPLEPRGLRLVGGEVADGGGQLGRRLVGPVGLEDAGLRLHDLRQPPERQALAVGKRAPLAPDDQLRIVVDRLEELAHQP